MKHMFNPKAGAKSRQNDIEFRYHKTTSYGKKETSLIRFKKYSNTWFGHKFKFIICRMIDFGYCYLFFIYLLYTFYTMLNFIVYFYRTISASYGFHTSFF